MIQSVTRFGKIVPFWLFLKYLAIFVRLYPIFGKILTKKFLWAYLHFCKWPNIKAICSLWGSGRHFLFKNGPTIFTKNQCEKISIQYTALGFEPTTLCTWVVTHNHKTRPPAQNVIFLIIRINSDIILHASIP